MPKDCKHQFIRIADTEKIDPKGYVGGLMVRGIPGAVCGCINCGEVRTIFIDGMIEKRVEAKYHL